MKLTVWPAAHGPPLGTKVWAASSKVQSSSARVFGFSPQASDISITFCPLGPVITMSMSSPLAEWRSSRVTETLVTVPESPETTMLDGYSIAGPKTPASSEG